MSERRLCPDAIRERELEECNVYAHVHSDGEYVSMIVDRETFDYVRRKLANDRSTTITRSWSRPAHFMREVAVTMSIK